MQDSGTTPLPSPGFPGALTTVHFAIIAVLAVLTIIGIVYGMRLARRRREGTRMLEESGHLERSGDGPATDPDRPGEAVAAHEPATHGQAALEGDTTDVVQVAPAPAPAPAPAAVEEASVQGVASPDIGASDLTLLKGLGPRVAAMLVEQGVPDIATLAKLDDAQADAVAARLGTFAPRMARDRWIEQARYLAAGDKAGFEAVFGKL